MDHQLGKIILDRLQQKEHITSIAQDLKLSIAQCNSYLDAYINQLRNFDENLNAKLLKEHLWSIPALSGELVLPNILQTSYKQLYQLYTDNQIYGGFLQTKDLFEVLLKFPILLYTSLKQQDGGLNDEILENLLGKPLSLGDWLSIGIQIRKEPVLGRYPYEQALHSIIEGITKVMDTSEIVKWRNEKLGHGAIATLDNASFFEDLEDKLKLLKKIYDAPFMTYYETIEVHLIDGAWTFKVEHSGQQVDLAPFLLSLDPDNLFFFDSYYSRKEESSFLDYITGTKLTIDEKTIQKKYYQLDVKERLKRDILLHNVNELTYINKSLEQKLLEEIRSMYVPPKYLYDWIEKRVTKQPKGIFAITLDQGMGKTTFVQAMDEWAMNYIYSSRNNKKNNKKIAVFERMHRRAIYFKLNEKDTINLMRHQLTRVFNKVDVDGKRIEIDGYSPFTTTQHFNRKAFANILNEYYRTYKNIAGERKLLLMFDGFDELSKADQRTIMNILPTTADLTDGIYILLTCRNGEAANILPVTPDNLLHVTEQSEQNITILKRFLDEFVVKDEDQQQQILQQLPNKTLLRLHIYADFKKLNYEITNEQTDHIIEHFIHKIVDVYATKYSQEVLRIMAILANSKDALTLDQLTMLTNNDILEKQIILGILRDIKAWLHTDTQSNEKCYCINNADIKQAILVHPLIMHAYEQLMAGWYTQCTRPFQRTKPDDYVMFLFVHSSDNAYTTALFAAAKHAYYSAQSIEQLQFAKQLLLHLLTLLPKNEPLFIADVNYTLAELEFMLTMYVPAIELLEANLELLSIRNLAHHHAIIKTMQLYNIILHRDPEEQENDLLKRRPKFVKNLIKLNRELSLKAKNTPEFEMMVHENNQKLNPFNVIKHFDEENMLRYTWYFNIKIEQNKAKGHFQAAQQLIELLEACYEQLEPTAVRTLICEFQLLPYKMNVIIAYYNKQVDEVKNNDRLHTMCLLHGVLTIHVQNPIKLYEDYFYLHNELMRMNSLIIQLNKLNVENRNSEKERYLLKIAENGVFKLQMSQLHINKQVAFIRSYVEKMMQKDLVLNEVHYKLLEYVNVYINNKNELWAAFSDKFKAIQIDITVQNAHDQIDQFLTMLLSKNDLTAEEKQQIVMIFRYFNNVVQGTISGIEPTWLSKMEFIANNMEMFSFSVEERFIIMLTFARMKHTEYRSNIELIRHKAKYAPQTLYFYNEAFKAVNQLQPIRNPLVEDGYAMFLNKDLPLILQSFADILQQSDLEMKELILSDKILPHWDQV